jgi:uncharacterized protein (TIGR02145 family)
MTRLLKDLDSVSIQSLVITSVLIVLLYLANTGCTEPSIPPLARLSLFPSSGDTTILFELNGSESFDKKFNNITLEYRWDYDGHPGWDSNFGKDPVLVQYFSEPGVYPVVMEVRNPDGYTSLAMDSITVYGRNRDISTLTDPRDGQTYRIVKLNGNWWMAESLRFGSVVNPWEGGMTDNHVPERVLVDNCFIPGSFSVYTWYEAMNYKLNKMQGLCPEGWHLPAMAEWESLYAGLPAQYRQQYLGKNGLSGINLNDGLSAESHLLDRTVYCMSLAGYWSSYHEETEAFGFRVGMILFPYNWFGFCLEEQISGSNNKLYMCSIRCIKD